MLKFIQKKLKEEKGLTLIELLAVIVILAIIAAIAIPAIGNIIQNSREDALVADAQNALAAANLYFTDQGSANGTNVTVETLVTEGFLDDPGSLNRTGTSVTKANGGNTLSGSATRDGVTATFTNATNAGLSANPRTGVAFTR